jgi:hypothetical protein
MYYEHNRRKYIKVQRLINISMAEAYRTRSSEALCMLMGTTAIIIRLEEVAQRYKAKERTENYKIEFDLEVELIWFSRFRRVVKIEYYLLLGSSPACEYKVSTFRKHVSSPSS